MLGAVSDLVSVALLVAWMVEGGAGRPTPGVVPGGGLDGATGFALGTRSVTDDAEAAYERLLAMDDEAHDQMDRWIQEADAKGPEADTTELQRKIDERIGAVTKAYGEFLGRHPGHARARIAYGSFLNDTGQESRAKEEWEKALALDPGNPAVYNNLAGLYGHRGPVTNAFTFYEKAIALDPKEPVYYQNLATTVFLFRRDVMEHYGFDDEQKVFDKALALYRRAMELDPTNFVLAADTAQTYYGIKPPRHDEALEAWRKALQLASDDLERQGVRIHLARVQVQAGRFDEARKSLDSVTNTHFQSVKEKIRKTLESRIQGAKPGEGLAEESGKETVNPGSDAGKSR